LYPCWSSPKNTRRERKKDVADVKVVGQRGGGMLELVLNGLEVFVDGVYLLLRGLVWLLVAAALFVVGAAAIGMVVGLVVLLISLFA
jgi:hypothetical protein